ncbi:MAG TPA: methyltransferase domain-containing protein [Trichocoleus sp.]
MLLVAGISVVGLTAVGCAQERTFEPQDPAQTTGAPEAASENTAQVPEINPTRTPDVVYVPTPQPVVDEMLRLAQVQPDDVVYDLGSGDGRIVITAAERYGIEGVGIDIDPERIREANENAARAGVADQVEFRQEDLFETDFSEATVVTLYLLPELNLRLRPKLLTELEPGTRIVSHDFDMGNWEPDQVVEVNGRTVYAWVVPENVPEELRQAQN